MDILSCKICLSQYNNVDARPLILPTCGHTLCSGCLDREYEIMIANYRRRIRCPFCKMESPADPYDGISEHEFPKNYALCEFILRNELEGKVCPHPQETKEFRCSDPVCQTEEGFCFKCALEFHALCDPAFVHRFDLGRLRGEADHRRSEGREKRGIFIAGNFKKTLRLEMDALRIRMESLADIIQGEFSPNYAKEQEKRQLQEALRRLTQGWEESFTRFQSTVENFQKKWDEKSNLLCQVENRNKNFLVEAKEELNPLAEIVQPKCFEDVREQLWATPEAWRVDTAFLWEKDNLQKICSKIQEIFGAFPLTENQVTSEIEKYLAETFPRRTFRTTFVAGDRPAAALGSKKLAIFGNQMVYLVVRET